MTTDETEYESEVDTIRFSAILIYVGDENFHFRFRILSVSLFPTMYRVCSATCFLRLHLQICYPYPFICKAYVSTVEALVL